MLLIFCSLASYVSGTLIIVLLSSFGVPPYICYLIGGLLVTYQVTYLIIIIPFTRCRIVIGEQNFKIDWEIFKFKRSKKGKTQDLNYAELTVRERKSSEGDNVITREFGLHQGVYVHKVGYHLSRAEKEWLAQEINDFLEMCRSQQ
jgi:hypothetical protein